ncbi:formin-like protein 13 isoform X2 [Lates japonicus]|uniref:Formin-like protein 13 isoform X2 n=1 Tax=Lates japonicus TaxID=270547 RepID=A0AAD3M9Q2_LATJO|nr:formin-like protein 13 isoform X2 [Lates japonicus]
MDRHTEELPKLSNEQQLSIMHMVKNGELSIEDALNLARKDQVLKQQSLAEEEQKPSQYNFSVHKHGRYRWQKRVLQIDFKTKMLCSIEKGIIKRQLAFSIVKSCDDGVGSRYEVQLHPGQLTLVPYRSRGPTDGEVTSSVPVSIVIHLSDGDTRVQKPHSLDTFTLITHKNEYQFKVPVSDQTSAQGAIEKERDAWVHAIHKLCSDWKRKSKCEHMFMETNILRNLSIPEDTEDTNTDLESSGEFSGGDVPVVYPPVDYANADPTSKSGDHLSAGDMSPTHPSADYTKPVPKPRSAVKTPAQVTGPDVLVTSPSVVAPSSSPTSPPPSPACTPFTSSSTVPETLKHESGSSVVKGPSPQIIPAAPPLPFKLKTTKRKARTKAFHWDLVGSEKIAKSFWIQESTKRIEIDTSRLYEQFAVKDLGTFGAPEQSNTQHIMLNQKIAHNFNIFLKSFPVQPGELKDKLFIVNEEDGGLSDEHITSLRRYVPTMDDVEMYKSHKGPVSELHIVDQYMMEMCNIPHLSTQLDLLLILRELPISMSDLQPLINQKIRMCTQLCNCRSFVSVLEYLLAIGNYLNENAGKEKAKGFRLSSLTKLSQLRGSDRKFTLLHALVEQIMLHEPCLATFTQELAEFETVPGASIKGLTAEVDVLKNELQKVIQYRKTCKKRNAGAHNPNFSKDLKMAIEKYNTDLAALTKTCEEMKKLYSVILVRFGEPVDVDSQELFGLICQFVHDFKKTHAEIV